MFARMPWLCRVWLQSPQNGIVIKKINLRIFLYNLVDLQLYIFLDRDLHSVLAVRGDAGGAGAGPGVP